MLTQTTVDIDNHEVPITGGCLAQITFFLELLLLLLLQINKMYIYRDVDKTKTNKLSLKSCMGKFNLARPEITCNGHAKAT